MKTFISFFLLACVVSFVHAQPCKTIKQGMSQMEVLKLAGKPTEVDSLGTTLKDEKAVSMYVWQYGNAGKEGNQRVEFQDDKVVEVIADGKKYDELLLAVHRGEVPSKELNARIQKINQ